MTNAELNTYLAEKAMGYKLVDRHYGISDTYDTPMYWGNRRSKMVGTTPSGKAALIWEDWLPTTNYEHAFEVVTELAKKPDNDNEPMLYFYLTIIPDSGEVIAKFESYVPEMTTFEGRADTVPMAICLAAKKVVEWRSN